MFAMLFAAGLGTRLRPLTDALPKPAVPLLDRPLASHALERLAALGAERIAINTHHRSAELERALAPYAARATFVHEPVLLGTGGGLRNALRAIGAETSERPIVVINGDIVFWPDLEGAIAHHSALDAVATLVLRPDPRARALGSLGLDADGRVRQLLGRPGHSGDLRELMFTGVHVLSPRALRDLPHEGCVIRTAYRRWVDSGAVVGGFVDPAPWRDLGTLADYLQTNLDLASGALRWPSVRPAPDGVWIAPDAHVARAAELRSVVVGRNATVAAGVTLDRCVVWPDTHVTTSARDAVITPQGCVAIARSD